MADRPLRILQVCSASQLIYGAAISLLTLAETQRESGMEVQFLAFKGKEFASQIRERGFKVHEVKVRAKADPFGIAQMRQVMLDGRFDIVHTHLSTSSVNGCIAARWAKIPSVATVHGMSSRHSFGFADHLIGVSQGVKDHLISQGVPPEKVSVVYNGVEIRERIDRDLARGIVGISSGTIVLGTVSRVTAMKGIEDALRAFALVVDSFPNLLYLVVGDGDALEGCKDLAKTLGIEDRVRFEGYRNNVHIYLAAMDLFVFPTHKEAMGIALVEAMAAGLPSVASDVGGVPEVLTADTGVLFPVGNFESIASSIAQLLSNPATMTQMGIAARVRAETVFSRTAMERSTEKVYRELLRKSLPISSETTTL